MIEAEERAQPASASPYRSKLDDFFHSESEKSESEHHQTDSGSGSRRSKRRAFLLSGPNFVSSFANGASACISPRQYGFQMDGTPNLSANSANASPYILSPWNQSSSPYSKSPWTLPSPLDLYDLSVWSQNGLIASLVREEGHIYSLAVSGDLLYTGSDSRNIRSWKKLKEYSGIKSRSGLIKAIVILGDNIFTGHQDGKIRIWKFSPNSQSHRRIGSLPTFRDCVKSSIKRKNYVEVRRHKNAVKIKHFDAISSLSLDGKHELLYSGSWDKTVKVWRISDSKCLESIHAHDDAVNSVAVGFHCLAFSGSADGTVKVWRREFDLKGKTKHFLAQVLLKQDNAVTALAVNRSSTVLYSGSSNGLLNFWEGDGKKSHLRHGGVLRGHKQAVLCLATAGNLAFSGSTDKNICVWKRDAQSGDHSCLCVLTGHTGPVKCLAVEEEPAAEEYDDEEDPQMNQATDTDWGFHRWIVYSGSLDKTVKVWRVLEPVPTLNSESELAINEHAPIGEGKSLFPSPSREMVDSEQ